MVWKLESFSPSMGGSCAENDVRSGIAPSRVQFPPFASRPFAEGLLLLGRGSVEGGREGKPVGAQGRLGGASDGLAGAASSLGVGWMTRMQAVVIHTVNEIWYLKWDSSLCLQQRKPVVHASTTILTEISINDEATFA